MNFTIEAIYALHMLNDHSEPLPFLPLPLKEDEEIKVGLLRILEQGFEDLKEIGLIIDNLPTEECGLYGAYIKSYAEATYHCQIDGEVSYAPCVDEFQRMAIIIFDMGDNTYQIDRSGSITFLAHLMATHPVLRDLDATMKDYYHSEWEIEALLTALWHHGNDEAIRITVQEYRKKIKDSIFFKNDDHLYEYDMSRQQQRSIDSEQLKHQMMRNLKVRF